MPCSLSIFSHEKVDHLINQIGIIVFDDIKNSQKNIATSDVFYVQ